MDIGARGSRQTETVQCVFRSESLTDSNTHASSSPHIPIIMSFQDIESGSNQPLYSSSQDAPQSREEAAFISLQSSLSLQVFKINANVQGILKLVDQLGTPRDSSALRKSLCV